MVLTSPHDTSITTLSIALTQTLEGIYTTFILSVAQDTAGSLILSFQGIPKSG